MEPMTAAVIMGGAGVAKGVSGYKAGQASSRAAAATAGHQWRVDPPGSGDISISSPSFRSEP